MPLHQLKRIMLHLKRWWKRCKTTPLQKVMPSLKLAPNQTGSGMWSTPFYRAIAMSNRDARLKRKQSDGHKSWHSSNRGSKRGHKWVQAILTRAEAKAKTKGATILTRAGTKASNDLIVNTDKTAIEVNSDEEFEAFTTDEEVMEEAMNMFK